MFTEPCCCSAVHIPTFKIPLPLFIFPFSLEKTQILACLLYVEVTDTGLGTVYTEVVGMFNSVQNKNEIWEYLFRQRLQLITREYPPPKFQSKRVFFLQTISVTITSKHDIPFSGTNMRTIPIAVACVSMNLDAILIVSSFGASPNSLCCMVTC